MIQRLYKVEDAARYLAMSVPTFNAEVRPTLVEIPQGRCVKFDRVDLDKWADDYKAANGKAGPKMVEQSWQKQRLGSDAATASGIFKKQSTEGNYAKALDAIGLKTQSVTCKSASKKSGASSFSANVSATRSTRPPAAI